MLGHFELKYDEFGFRDNDFESWNSKEDIEILNVQNSRL